MTTIIRITPPPKDDDSNSITVEIQGQKPEPEQIEKIIEAVREKLQG